MSDSGDRIASGVEYILWDHDGVLVDTEPCFYEATRLTLKEYGVAVSPERWATIQAEGRGLKYLVASAGLAPLDFTEVRALRDQRYDDLLATNDVLIEGAVDVLEQLSQRFRMALVTTSLRRFVDQIHGRTSVLEHFEHIVSREDCERVKPDPEPYRRAMSLLGATSARSVAVEDSPRGLASAVAAGLRCFVVRSDFMATADFDGAHAILDDIRELPEGLAVAS